MIGEEKLLQLQARALQLRIDSVRATTRSKSGHPTTALSSADIISVLFFHAMNFDIADPAAITNDRFILSKGHGVPILYAAYKQLGVISDDELLTLRDFDSRLEGHPTPRFIYNEAATGSLGQGLAIGVGMALQASVDKLSYKTYVLFGDGELAEGSVWEAAQLAAHYRLANLVGIIDCNRLGQAGQSLHGHDVGQFQKKFDAFGWNSVVVDGHDIQAIEKAIEDAQQSNDKPTMIVAKTYKGYGLDGIQNQNGFHGKPITQDRCDEAITSLNNRFVLASDYLKVHDIVAPKVTVVTKQVPQAFVGELDITNDANKELFEKGKSIPTRKAFGYALAALGSVCDEVIVLDADVKNSTHTDIFEKSFPDRFFQCFIAEQTMVGVAVGLESRKKIPFAATFGAFFTRAHDQIRMAGIGRNALRLCGSHCGVSIGEDGPSQMALEDLAMMRSIPNSIVLYPSDGVSAYKLVEDMATMHDGVSYMRTTRASTPILYDMSEDFRIGGCKVLHESDDDQLCIVAAGITLHEGLQAYEQLKEQGIFVSVIDAYSIKPLDTITIKSIAKKSKHKIMTVEDHYSQGGLGEAVAHALVNDDITVEMLAVETISRSGTPQKLLAYAQIDAASIVQRCKKLLS